MVANLQNCKRLYELSGWDRTAKWWYNTGATGWKVDTGHTPLTSKYYDADDKFKPAYDLGYLLRKLQFAEAGLTYSSNLDNDKVWGCAVYDLKFQEKSFIQTASTPEDACALLCIKLFEEGVLNGS